MIVNVEGAFMTATFPSLQVYHFSDISSQLKTINAQKYIRFGVIVLRNLEGILDERLHLPEFTKSIHKLNNQI